MVIANDESGSSINQPHGKGNERGLNGAFHAVTATDSGNNLFVLFVALSPAHAFIKLRMILAGDYQGILRLFHPGYR